MNSLAHILFLLVCLNASKTVGKKHFLVCPAGYTPFGQAWYAEAPNNIITDAVKPSSIDFSQALISGTPPFQPRVFLVCVICHYHPTLGSSLEYEVCMGKEAKRKYDWAYERRSCSSTNTLAWCNTPNAIGLEIDSSQGDLLSTLGNIRAITNSSLRYQFQNCPNRLKIKAIEERATIDKKSYHRQCIICSGESLIASSCVSQSQSYDHPSILLPSLAIVDPDCPWSSKSNSTCRLKMSELLTGNQSPCGLFVSPYDFLYKPKKFMAKDLKFDCEFQIECTG
jgi:hypothetical protein